MTTRVSRRTWCAGLSALIASLVLSASAAAAGDLVIEPAEVNFGTQWVGDSTERTVTIRNQGADPVQLNDVYVAGDNVDPFDFVSGSCTPDESLAVDGECQLTLRFAPTTATLGTVEAFLIVEGSLEEESAIASLVGVGQDGAGLLKIEPRALTFPPTRKGATSVERRVVVRNIGPGPVRGIAVTLWDRNFTVSSDCPATLYASAECVVTVAFAPKDNLGRRIANLRVSWGDGHGTFVLVTGSIALPLAPTGPYALIERDLARLTESVPKLLRGGPRAGRMASFIAPVAGTLKARVYGWSGRARLLVAKGSKRLARGAEHRLRLQLTSKGQKLLRGPKRTRIKVVLSFIAAADGEVSKQAPEYMVKPPKAKRKRA